MTCQKQLSALIVDDMLGSVAGAQVHGLSPLSPALNRHYALEGRCLDFSFIRRLPEERHRPASLFGLVRSGGEVLVESRNGLVQAIGDHLRVVCQRRTGVGMAEVTLQILHARVLLNVCGRGTP